MKPHIMPSQVSGFDRVAAIYDLLARLVFGNQLDQAKVRFFSQIRPGQKVLIMGGGTGWILPKVLERVGESGSVLFIEASDKMLQRARKRIRAHIWKENVCFVHGTQDSIPKNEAFDQIHTHFFLDLFKQPELILTIQKLDRHLAPRGLWFLTDFAQPRHPWNLPAKWLIGLMYLFFRILCGIQGSKLPDFHSVLLDFGYELTKDHKVWNGMIESFLYQKMGPNSEL